MCTYWHDKKCSLYQAVTSKIYLKQQKITMADLLNVGLKMRE